MFQLNRLITCDMYIFLNCFLIVALFNNLLMVEEAVAQTSRYELEKSVNATVTSATNELQHNIEASMIRGRHKSKKRESSDGSQQNYTEQSTETSLLDDADLSHLESALDFAGVNHSAFQPEEDKSVDQIADSSTVHSAETNFVDGISDKIQTSSNSVNHDLVEELVRNQVNQAASDWPTVPPIDATDGHNAQQSTDERLAVLDLNSTNPTLAQSESSKPTQRRFRDPNRHNNHNYGSPAIEGQKRSPSRPISQSDLSSGPWHADMFAILRPTSDPMTTSSSDDHSDTNEPVDKTNPFKAVKLSYKYNIEPQIRRQGTSDTKKHHHPQRPAGPTLSPKIMRAYQILDNMKSREIGKQYTSAPVVSTNSIRRQFPEKWSQSQHDTHVSGTAKIEHSIAPPETQVERVRPLYQAGNINENGFVDVPDESVGFPINTGQQILPIHEHKGDENSTKNAWRPLQDREGESLLMTTPNLNGNLAARLSANRFKNRLLDSEQARRWKQQLQTNQQSQPLSVSFGRNQETPSRLQNEPTTNSFVYASTTPIAVRLMTPAPARMRGTTVSDLGMAAHQDRMSALRMSNTRYASPTARTTVPVTSSTSSMSPATTQATIPPALVNAILAAALNSSRAAAMATSQTVHSGLAIPNKLAHHHLHSHVHSIKPAVISLPVQSNQPKYNPYESILAAAAAAAAAATATRPRTETTNNQQQQFGTYLKNQHPPKPLGQRQLLSRAQSLISGKTIPIGGTLASVPSLRWRDINHNRPHVVSTTPSLHTGGLQVPSILGNLIESANRALKQVAGSKSSSGSAFPLHSLQTSQSNQVTSTHHDPDLTAPINLDGIPTFYTMQHGVKGYHKLGYDLGPGTAGLFQIPNDDSLPLSAYFANLLDSYSALSEPSQDQTSAAKGLNDAYLTAIEGEKSESTSLAHLQQSSMLVPSEWDPNSTSNTLDPDSVVFAPLGGNSNILYPLYKTGTNGQFTSADGLQNPLADFLDPQALKTNKLPEVTNWVDQFINDEHHVIYRRPISSQAAKGPNGVNTVQISGGKTVSSNKNSPIEARPFEAKHQTMKQQHFMDHSDPIPFAMTHYIDEQRLQDVRHPSSGGQQWHHSLIDVFHDNRGPNLSMSPPIRFVAADSIDGYRIANQQARLNHSATARPEKPSESYQPTQQQVDRGRKVQIVRSVKKDPQISGSQGMHSSDEDFFYSSSGSAPPRPVPAQMLQLSGYQVYPSEVIHQALAHAGSSLKPHLMAANEFVNQQKQQLLENVFLQNHPHLIGGHDMATSESVRMAATATRAPARLAVLAHFWPLGLALLPVMIVVAIITQLVMAAPLMLFALTTLTIARFAAFIFGPLRTRKMDDDSPGVLGKALRTTPSVPGFPSQNFHLANTTANSTDYLVTFEDSLTRESNSTTGEPTLVRRRRRAASEPNLAEQLEIYMHKILMELERRLR